MQALAQTAEFQEELDEARRKMFPPVPEEVEREGNQLIAMEQVPRRTLVYVSPDSQIFVWNPLRSKILHLPDPNAFHRKWTQCELSFKPESQWYFNSLNAAWTLCGSTAVIYGGSKLTMVDIETGDLVVSGARMHFANIPPHILATMRDFSKGQFQYSSHLRCFIYAILEECNVNFLKLVLSEDKTTGTLEVLPIPHLPLANFEDFPTRFMLAEKGSKIFLYNAKPPPYRPARNEIFMWPLSGLQCDSMIVVWTQIHVTDVLEVGDWRKRFHPRIESLWIDENRETTSTLFGIDYEWHFSYPDSGYGIFRVCKLETEEGNDEIGYGGWKVEREVMVSSEYLGDVLSLPSGGHLSRLASPFPYNHGQLLFLGFGSPGLPVSICSIQMEPKKLSLSCANQIRVRIPALRSIDKNDLVKDLHISSNIIEKYIL